MVSRRKGAVGLAGHKKHRSCNHWSQECLRKGVLEKLKLQEKAWSVSEDFLGRFVHGCVGKTVSCALAFCTAHRKGGVTPCANRCLSLASQGGLSCSPAHNQAEREGAGPDSPENRLADSEVAPERRRVEAGMCRRHRST